LLNNGLRKTQIEHNTQRNRFIRLRAFFYRNRDKPIFLLLVQCHATSTHFSYESTLNHFMGRMGNDSHEYIRVRGLQLKGNAYDTKHNPMLKSESVRRFDSELKLGTLHSRLTLSYGAWPSFLSFSWILIVRCARHWSWWFPIDCDSVQ